MHKYMGWVDHLSKVILCLDFLPFEGWGILVSGWCWHFRGVLCVSAIADDSFDNQTPNVEFRRRTWKQAAWRKESKNLFRLSGCGLTSWELPPRTQSGSWSQDDLSKTAYRRPSQVVINHLVWLVQTYAAPCVNFAVSNFIPDIWVTKKIAWKYYTRLNL